MFSSMASKIEYEGLSRSITNNSMKWNFDLISFDYHTMNGFLCLLFISRYRVSASVSSNLSPSSFAGSLSAVIHLHKCSKNVLKKNINPPSWHAIWYPVKISSYGVSPRRLITMWSQIYLICSSGVLWSAYCSNIAYWVVCQLEITATRSCCKNILGKVVHPRVLPHKVSTSSWS